MKCNLCGKQFEWLGKDPPEEPVCPKCIRDRYNSDLARSRANRVRYHKELVVIGKAEFECSGYYDDGRLYDEEIFINGQDVYGLMSDQVQAQIFEEISRRVVADEIDKICERHKEIEQELPDSKDPATLRLERSEGDSKLEKLEKLEAKDEPIFPPTKNMVEPPEDLTTAEWEKDDEAAAAIAHQFMIDGEVNHE